MRQGIRVLFRAVGILLLLMPGIMVFSAQTPEDFGYNRIAATGFRPLLVILTEFQGSPALRNNAPGYFDNLVFSNIPTAGSPSLKAYFVENSNERFYWYRGGAGVVGP